VTPRFEIRPLGAWGRPRSEPQPSRFRARWDDTIALLLREVEHLDGQLVVVQVDAPAGQIRRDGMLYARAQVYSPAVKISFDSRHGPLTYATDAYGYWQDNVRAIALALGALRAVDRYGVSGSGEQYRGWSQITASPAEADLTAHEARRVLADAAHTTPDQLHTDAQVKIAYRVAAAVAHPDRGGNPDVFRLVTAARDVLLRSAS
jgi:hypothetical protein